MGIGYTELLFIFVIILIFFGGRKIPEVARGLGKGINEFKKAKNELTDSIAGDTTAVSGQDTALSPQGEETKKSKKSKSSKPEKEKKKKKDAKKKSKKSK